MDWHREQVLLQKVRILVATLTDCIQNRHLNLHMEALCPPPPFWGLHEHVQFFPNKIVHFRSLYERGWSVLWECYMVVAANRGNHHFSNFAEIF